MTGPLRVLHLEDSPRDAEMVGHKLDVEGVSCNILLANSKDSFKAALTREPFDLILSDYNLPGVWEIEFARNRLTWFDTMAPLFGLTPDHAPNTTEGFFQLIHADDRRATKAWAMILQDRENDLS